MIKDIDNEKNKKIDAEKHSIGKKRLHVEINDSNFKSKVNKKNQFLKRRNNEDIDTNRVNKKISNKNMKNGDKSAKYFTEETNVRDFGINKNNEMKKRKNDETNNTGETLISCTKKIKEDDTMNIGKTKNIKQGQFNIKNDTLPTKILKNNKNKHTVSLDVNKKKSVENNDCNKKEKSIESFTKKYLYVINNLSHKETEESIKKYFSSFGYIEKITLQKNKKDIFVGKAILTLNRPLKLENDIILNGKILRVERIKDQMVNDKRLFVSHMNKNLSVLEIRNLLKENEIKPIDIRIRYDTVTKKNNGFCHLTYSNNIDAKKFENKWNFIKEKLGPNATYDYSYEKPEKFYR